MIVTSYKRIDTKARWLGIDLFDAVGVIVVFALLSMFLDNLFFNLSACLLTYIGLRILKASKPQGWFLDWLKYHLRSPYYSAAVLTEEGHDGL